MVFEATNWWRLPIKGSFGGPGGNFFGWFFVNDLMNIVKERMEHNIISDEYNNGIGIFGSAIFRVFSKGYYLISEWFLCVFTNDNNDKVSCWDQRCSTGHVDLTGQGSGYIFTG